VKNPCTGVILAGGLNKRFAGKNKAFIRICGKRIIDYIYNIFKELFKEIIIVTNDPVKYIEWDVRIVTDIMSARSSLTGIHTGLFFATNRYTFITACDTPFLKRGVVETIIDGIKPGYSVTIPETPNGLEPLCAVYSKHCLKPIEQQIVNQEFKIKQFLKKKRLNKIPENVLRDKDPDLLSFFNMNTPSDFVRAEQIAEKLEPDTETGCF